MKEQDWLTCADPLPMLRFLQQKDILRTNGGHRKARLFACACCRHVWRLLPDERSRRSVEVAELHADGLADGRLLAEVNALAAVAAQDFTRASGGTGSYAVWAAESVSRFDRIPVGDLQYAAINAASAPAAVFEGRVNARLRPTNFTRGARKASRRLVRQSLVGMAGLLRCIIGNPFRPVPTDPSWLSWNDGAVGKIARTIYDERRFSDLPLLADALEEAGCSNPEILGHCRNGGEHVRGCWVVDLLLGKE